ncbi:MAG: M20/M25/M40 family metallo-hydrolase [Actinomycetota bacterium]|nr:M20/M25/M40 family metallo-hydrolase [Actinomycetota bacterium]
MGTRAAKQPWIAEAAERIAERAPQELEALVAVSSPSGDRAGAEAAVAVAAALAPEGGQVERLECSTEGHAQDLLVRVRGTGSRRLLLLGHVDTVIAHDEHRPLARDDGRLVGSGAVDMKGGVVLALGVLRAFAARPAEFRELALLLVCDEEWRVGEFAHVPRFAGFDACLCFEGGQLSPDGEEGVVVKRKAAGTLKVRAHGRSAHSGSAPEMGANALLALAAAAQVVAKRHDPTGPDHLTAVPTVLRSGEAFNVVPAAGELLCDLRADVLEAFEPVLHALPGDVEGVRLEAEIVRRWPGMDARQITAPLLRAAGERLGRRVVGLDRGGASDASHFAPDIALTVDGLGPLGGHSHAPDEYVVEASLRSRAEVALAVVEAVLAA